jgi:hypothetical protein
MTNVQESGTAAIALPRIAPQRRFTAGGAMMTSALLGRDNIRRTGPHLVFNPIDNPIGNPLQSGLGSILSQLLGALQQLLSMFGVGSAFGSAAGGEQYFANASGSSTGDPHLAFNGNSGGGTQAAHFDSMTDHPDLLESDSFAGGYQISTNVTQPGANGVTYNRQATVSTGFGGTQVSLDNSGNATIMQNGQTITLADGQSMALGNGETVTRNANGSVIVRDDNGLGGTITTTLSENGKGVDVNVQSSNVDLGGDLLAPPQLSGRPLPVTL